MNKDNKQMRKNFFIIGKEKYYESNKENLKRIVDILNKDKLVIISGLRNIGKVNFIKNLLNKTQITHNYFYFNKSEDLENTINSYKDMVFLLNDYVRLYKKPSIIILQNIEKIEGIKDFIGEIYKQKYKIILVGNNIKIGGIKEIEILNDYIINEKNLNSIIKHGSLNEINKIEKLSKIIQSDLDELKEKYLKLFISDVFLNDILINFGLKNIELYKYTMSYLANISIFQSLREIQTNIDSINNISLKTAIDYIDFSIQEKIIKRVYNFDLKTNKPITSKAKYYFTDNGIRNSLTNFIVDKSILIENLIFNILECNNYYIYGGLSGKFDFSFYGEKESTKIFIHISRVSGKEDIKKEVGKLLKIGIEGRKILLVENIENLGIKKLNFDGVEIMEIEDFLKNFGKTKT